MSLSSHGVLYVLAYTSWRRVTFCDRLFSGSLESFRAVTEMLSVGLTTLTENIVQHHAHHFPSKQLVATL